MKKSVLDIKVMNQPMARNSSDGAWFNNWTYFVDKVLFIGVAVYAPRMAELMVSLTKAKCNGMTFCGRSSHKGGKTRKTNECYLAWIHEKYNHRSNAHIDEETLRETLKEQTKDEKAREEKIRQKQADDDEYFMEFGAWVSATNYVNAFGGTVTGCLEDNDNFLKKGKLEQVVAIVKSCSLNAFGDLM
uniref:Uncharacterized protein n=1 Tax=Tanacetum cinerariifolium TaxID=118510 RepID=A0A6L2LU54_TANCI|nr:hypothetical protein [Tanacetum cinerariifolium]